LSGAIAAQPRGCGRELCLGGDHDVVVEGHVNGDGKADFQIEVQNDIDNLTSLAKGDFVL
jgi:hypothetical protein